MTGAGIGRVVLLALIAVAPATPLRAQQATPARARPSPEVRVDYLGPNPQTLHVGAGVNVPVGTYLRLSVVGAGGASWQHGGAAASARADVIGRFAFDPFRERRWGLSAGGGLSVRHDQSAADGRRRWRALVALVVDLEGQRVGSVAPALQIGLGGGGRAGVVIRGADPGRR